MDALEVDIAGRAGAFQVSARFSAGPGVTALFGRSGAGKSTILKMIAGLARPESGHISAGGRVLFDAAAGVDLPARARGLGFVFQEDRLFPHLTVRRNLTYARWAGRRPVRRPIEEVVALLGLEAHLDRLPETLSGGERQRVAIGRALLADPRILLMDEPLSSLDRERRDEILPYVEKIAGEARIPVLYVSHDTEEVARLADRVVAVEGGLIRAVGTPAEILGLGLEEGEGPVSILEGRVARYDARYRMALVALGEASMELSTPALPVGTPLRLSVRAFDVAIATRPHDGLSIRNQLWCTVRSVSIAEASAQVELALGGERLIARITAKSAADLGLSAGQRVVALVKAVSVERGRVGRPAAGANGEINLE